MAIIILDGYNFRIIYSNSIQDKDYLQIKWPSKPKLHSGLIGYKNDILSLTAGAGQRKRKRGKEGCFNLSVEGKRHRKGREHERVYFTPFQESLPQEVDFQICLKIRALYNICLKTLRPHPSPINHSVLGRNMVTWQCVHITTPWVSLLSLGCTV